jgi:tape measure domain-containing protein
MAGQNFPLSLIISAVDRATGPLRRINSNIARFTAPARAVSNSVSSMFDEAGLSRVTAAFSQVGSAISGLGTAAMTSVKRAIGLLTGAGGLAFLFNREFIGTADTFQRLQISLETIEGSPEKAAKAMEFLKKTAMQVPMSLEDITNAFRLMRGQGMDPMNGQLRSLIDYTSKLGGSSDMLLSIATQLSQATSKTKLQQQDVRVMAEQGVGVWGLLARAVERVSKGTRKITPAELIAMSEKGQLGLKAINLLIEQMGLESQGASTRMMSTWSGMLSNLKVQWELFKLRVMSSGPLDFLKSKLNGLLEKINTMAANGDLQKLADNIGGRLVAAFNALLGAIPQVWAALQDMGGAVKFVADLVGGWGNLLKIVATVYILGPVVSALVTLTAAFITLGAAIGLTPIGWILAGFAAMAVAAVLLVRNWKSVQAFFADVFGGLQQTVRGFLAFWTGVFTLNIGKTIQGIEDYFTGLWTVIKEIVNGILALPRAAAQVGGGIGHAVRRLFGFDAADDAAAPPASPDAARLGGFAFMLPRPSHVAPTGALVPGAALAPALASSHSQADAHVTVDFKNAPRGTRVAIDPKGNAPLDISMGYAMADAF